MLLKNTIFCIKEVRVLKLWWVKNYQKWYMILFKLLSRKCYYTTKKNPTNIFDDKIKIELWLFSLNFFWGKIKILPDIIHLYWYKMCKKHLILLLYVFIFCSRSPRIFYRGKLILQLTSSISQNWKGIVSMFSNKSYSMN